MKPKKPKYWYLQSGVVPFKRNNGNFEVLLIRSRKNKRWIFPKGIIEPGMSPEDSAAKDAFEEAGVKGKISTGYYVTYTYKKWGGICNVTVYPMEIEKVYEEWPESFRKRKWFNLSELEKVLKKKMVKIINDLVKFHTQ